MKTEELIKLLNECTTQCNYCADACLDEDNVKDMVTCIRLDKVCAAACRAAAEALTVNIDESAELVKACRTICERCADECAQHSADHCQKCAEVCLKCAKACAEYNP